MNRTPDELYENILEILAEANKNLYISTPNQQEMPQHLRGVAADFGRAKELIGELEQYALKSAKGWENNLSDNSNSYNSNATMEVGGRRRNRRKTRRGRKN